MLDFWNFRSSDSSDNETGNYTCDEGREADDEQSDWFAETGPVYGVPGASDSSSHGTGGPVTAWWPGEELGLSPSTKVWCCSYLMFVNLW